MRYVIRNVPLNVMAQVHVEIPDDTSEDKIHDTLANKLRAGEFKRKHEYDFEVETDLLDTGYVLLYERTRDQPVRDEEPLAICDTCRKGLLHEDEIGRRFGNNQALCCACAGCEHAQLIGDEEHEGRCDAIAARREDHQRDE